MLQGLKSEMLKKHHHTPQPSSSSSTLSVFDQVSHLLQLVSLLWRGLVFEYCGWEGICGLLNSRYYMSHAVLFGVIVCTKSYHLRLLA